MHVKNEAREAFEIAVYHLHGGTEWVEEPAALSEIVGGRVTVAKAIEALLHCTDIMPSHLYEAVVDVLPEGSLTRRTYGNAASLLKAKYTDKTA